MESSDIDNVLYQVRTYFDHDAAKQTLKEKYEAKMLFTAFGGLWKASPELLNITLERNGMPEEIVLLDQYGNPCKVNVKALYEMAWSRWQEQMNGWYDEYLQLQNMR